MTLKQVFIPAIAALLMSSVAYAQDATTEAPAEGDAKIEDELSMGEEVQPKTYIREEIGDWQLKCFGTGTENDPCQMYQLLNDEGDNSVAEFSLFRLSNGTKAAAGATIVVPLETLLTAKLSMAVDGGKPKVYDYSHCTVAGCFARVGLTEGDVAGLKRGAKAVMTLVPAVNPEIKINVDVSLTGFTAAYDKVTVLQQ